MPKIGDTIYLFEDSSRHYAEPSPEQKKAGKIYGELIWRRHWKPIMIVGENRVSWLLQWGNKIPKKPERTNNESPCFSEAEVDDRVFVNDHGCRISDRVRKCSANQLREVAKIIGYIP